MSKHQSFKWTYNFLSFEWFFQAKNRCVILNNLGDLGNNSSIDELAFD